MTRPGLTATHPLDAGHRRDAEPERPVAELTIRRMRWPSAAGRATVEA